MCTSQYSIGRETKNLICMALLGKKKETGRYLGGSFIHVNWHKDILTLLSNALRDALVLKFIITIGSPGRSILQRVLRLLLSGWG